jgi:hypothetical protein
MSEPSPTADSGAPLVYPDLPDGWGNRSVEMVAFPPLIEGDTP